MLIISLILQINSIVFEFQSIHIFKLQKEQKKIQMLQSAYTSNPIFL